MVGGAAEYEMPDGAEGCPHQEPAEDGHAQLAKRLGQVKLAAHDDLAGDRHEHQRGAVVEEALALHGGSESLGDFHAAKREQNAHRIGDGEQRPQEEGRVERQAQEERGHRGGCQERDGDSRHGKRRDRAPYLVHRLGVGEECPFEDQDREERDEDDFGIERRMRKHRYDHQEQTDHHQRDVVRDPNALGTDGDRRAYREDQQEGFEAISHVRTLPCGSKEERTSRTCYLAKPMDARWHVVPLRLLGPVMVAARRRWFAGRATGPREGRNSGRDRRPSERPRHGLLFAVRGAGRRLSGSLRQGDSPHVDRNPNRAARSASSTGFPPAFTQLP